MKKQTKRVNIVALLTDPVKTKQLMGATVAAMQSREGREMSNEQGEEVWTHVVDKHRKNPVKGCRYCEEK